MLFFRTRFRGFLLGVLKTCGCSSPGLVPPEPAKRFPHPPPHPPLPTPPLGPHPPLPLPPSWLISTPHPPPWWGKYKPRAGGGGRGGRGEKYKPRGEGEKEGWVGVGQGGGRKVSLGYIMRARSVATLIWSKTSLIFVMAFVAVRPEIVQRILKILTC